MICFDPIAPLPSTPAPVTFSTLANGKPLLQYLAKLRGRPTHSQAELQKALKSPFGA